MTITTDVTRRTLALGARDVTTGWRGKTWTDSTVEGTLLSKASQQIATAVGIYVRNDATFATADGVCEGDEIKTATLQHYEVKAVREHFIGDSFFFRECDLHSLPMHADIDVSVYAGTFSVDDARHRTKVYLETYWVYPNAQGDLGNGLGVEFMYDAPDYPLTLELKAPSVVDVIITLGKPESKPLRGHDFTPYGYEEKVPIRIWSMDKANMTAVKAVWQCEAELRRITETYLLGSLRGFEKTRDLRQTTGSGVLEGTEYVLTYRRDPT